MVRLEGDLDPETGQEVLTAIARSWTPTPEERTATTPARPAPCRRARRDLSKYLDSADRPTVAGERPHLSLSMDIEALRSRRGVGEFENAGAVGVATARRVACDAAVSRVVLNARSEPLDLGRRIAVVSAALRRALAMRDGRCRFPGCDRRGSWCDAHHVVHWANGGETSLSNLVLLCRRHHRAVHERFEIRMVDGRPVFVRRDGTLLEDRAPP
jgi:hypothetical protein